MSEEIVCVILYQHMRSLLLQNKTLVFIRCVLIQFVLLLLGDRFTELQTRQLNRELCCYSVRRVAWFLRCKLLSSQDIFHFTLTYNILHFINHTLSLFFGVTIRSDILFYRSISLSLSHRFSSFFLYCNLVSCKTLLVQRQPMFCYVCGFFFAVYVLSLPMNSYSQVCNEQSS